MKIAGALFIVSLACVVPAHALTFQEISTAAPQGLAEGGYQSAIIDPSAGFAWFASSVALSNLSAGTMVSVVTPVRLANFTTSTGVSTLPGVWGLSAAVYNPLTGAGYFGTINGSTATAVERDALTPPFVSPAQSSMTFQAGQATIGSAVIAPSQNYAYFGTLTSPASIVQVELSSLIEVSSLTLTTGFLTSAVVDAANGFAYFGSSTTPPVITQVNISTLAVVQTLTVPGVEGLTCAAIDTLNGYAYFGTSDSPGKVVKIRLSDFSIQGMITLNPGENQLVSAVADPAFDHTYFGTATSSGVVVQVVDSGFFRSTAITMGAGQNNLTSAVLDPINEYAYFGTNTLPGAILKIDLLYGPAAITKQPSSQTIQEGASASFSVTAIGRSISYQWLLNGTPIAGATGPSVSLVNPSLGLDGSTLSCQVANGFGTITTEGALLSVIPGIRVFPDPWRADKHAGVPITFDGLAPNSVIRIYTLSMHWVKSLHPSGVTAVWDRTNDAGQSVASGYYFYRINTSDSQQTVTGKLAIIK